MKLFKDKSGQVGVMLFFVFLTILLAVGFSIDFYRIEVDKQELARATDVLALAIAASASVNDDMCIIEQINVDSSASQVWDYNKKNRLWSFELVSTNEQRAQGIVKVSSRSYLPLYFTSRWWGNHSSGYDVIGAVSEVKCTPK